MVEVAKPEDLYKNPIHPYTKALLSAIPQPNPISEKKRRRIIYKPAEVHNYDVEAPSMVEVLPEHFVYASPSEVVKYREGLGIKND